MSALRPFHLAIPVRNIAESRAFYGEMLGCPEGRSAEHWVDFNFYGHQLVTHLDEQQSSNHAIHNPVDGHGVPVPHFGVVLSMTDWKELRDRLRQAEVEFIIEPYIRFRGEPGEQATMFFADPSGNHIEIKAFEDLSQLFAR